MIGKGTDAKTAPNFPGSKENNNEIYNQMINNVST